MIAGEAFPGYNGFMVKYLFWLSLVIFPLVGPGWAQAQESLEVQQPISSGVTYEQLRADYFFQLEKYLEAQRRFELDKAEFNKLQTLSSREKAVESMRPYLEARARVLFTYLTALEFLLQNKQGVDVVAKEQTIVILNRGKAYLVDYIDSIPSLDDRDKVNQSSAEFETTGRALVLEGQFRTLTLLATGRINVVYDQLKSATNEFKESYVVNVPSEGTRAQIERGLRDVDFQNELAETNLKQVIETFPPMATAEDLSNPRYRPPNYGNVYTQSVAKLQTVYAAMKKSIQYLKELEKQT